MDGREGRKVGQLEGGKGGRSEGRWKRKVGKKVCWMGGREEET